MSKLPSPSPDRTAPAWRTTALALLTAMMLLASACSSSNEPVTQPPSGDDTSGDTVVDTDPEDSSSTGDEVVDLGDDDIQLAAFLKPFAECTQLLEHLQTEAAERVGPWGLNGGGYYGPEVMEMEMEMEEEAMSDGDSADAAFDTAGGDDSAQAAEAPAEATFDQGEGGVDGDGDFSTTNVQELGVDEPDLVKTDGTNIYLLKDNTLHVFDVSGDEPVRKHRVALGDDQSGGAWHHQMFIANDRVYVIGEGNGALPFSSVGIGGATDDVASDIAEPDFPGEPGFYVQSTAISEIDLSDAEAEPAIRSLHIEGYSVSARLVGSDLRFVVSTFPNDLGFVQPGANNEKALDTATEVNKGVIAESTLEDWLPAYSLVVDGEVTTGLVAECNQVHQPNTFAGFGALSVVSIDTSKPLDAGTGSTVLSEGQTVYASTESLYVTTNSWIDPRSWEDANFRPDNDWSTSIHKFATPVGAPATYQASGSVNGSLLNQFSMSEHNGIFRVATTDGTPWGDGDSESFITTFDQQGDALVQLGQVGEMGKGERIFSVRYVGDLAYVVTFRQTDPLYTVDLADPANPVVLGELKITGYSGYLHPISPGLVVGIGQEATDEGRTQGTKVTLFDVSDLAAPTDIDNWVLEDSYTEAEWDHRSVLWWAESNLLVIPIQEWRNDFFGAVALTIADGSITETGRISHVASGEIGQSDCRQLTVDDLPEGSEDQSELWWILQEDEGRLQACSPNQNGGVSGYYCDIIPVDEIDNWFGPVPGEIDFGDADRIEWCWLDSYQNAINRSLVIGPNIWTVSQQTLQANDLATLEVVSQIGL